METKNIVLSIQYEPVINNVKKNLKIAESLIEQSKEEKPDLIVLPEFFSTGISHKGFILNAENENDPVVLNFLSETARKYGANIVGGTIIEKEKDKFYNTSYIFDRKGEIVGKYRKIHLFSYFGGCEHEVITKGENISVVELDFASVGVGICFDIRFPLHFNKLVKSGAEIIVCPNAWCCPIKSDDKLLQIKKNEMKSFAVARAAENLVYFVGSSFSGKLGSGLISCADSIIVSPEGEILKTATDKKEAIYAKINLDIVQHFKKEFPLQKRD